MKRIFYLLILGFGSLLCISNAAQPGVWSAGGSGSFQLLFPEDSTAYKKVQMQSEQIFMQLYKGYAVVKGSYNFYNTTNDTLRIKVGYPINNVFPNVAYTHRLNQVRVDDLYKIQGKVNDSLLPIHQQPNHKNDNWYVWDITFLPKTTTVFTVYFVVNTNNAQIIDGYEKDYKNAFIYLIETGSLWKSPIEKGEFYTQLLDSISLQSLKGSAPSKLFYSSEHHLLKFTLKDYGKTPDQNFVLTYAKKDPKFNFKKITQNSTQLFQRIDLFSKTNFSSYSFSEITLKNPYLVQDQTKKLTTSKYNYIFYGIIILAIIIILLVRNWLRKK